MIVERSPAPLDRDLADVSSTAACDPSCSPAYSSSCSSPCSPYSDSEGSLSGSSNGSAWNVGGDHTRGGKQTKATFQGVRVRNSVKELLMHIRNSKLVSSTYGGEEFKGGWNIEQYRELNNIWSNTKRSYGYSSEGPACKRPTTFQTPPLLTPLHTPNSIDRMDDHHKNETRNKSCEMLQNIINIKNESSPVSLNTVQVSWMSSPVNSEQSLEEQYQDIQVKQTQECQVLKASSPQVMDQSQMCDFPYWSSQGLQTPFAHHSLTDSSQLSANCQFPNYEKGLFSSCQEVLYWPDQSFAYCLNETEGCPDTNIPVQLQPKASAQSLNYSPVSSNTVCCQQVLAGSCSSISPQCPSGDGNEVATMQPSKSFFQWQLDQEELRMANITQEQLLAKDSDGDTFLHIAVAQGRRARSYVLARKMAAVNKLDIKEHNNQTALQVAVAANQHLIVQDLVGLGAQVNTTDCWGRTPLHVCAEKGYSQVLQAIQKGVNGNNQYVDAEATNYDGITALHCAVMAHNAVVHGMPKNQQPHTPEVQELLLKSKGLVDTIKMLIEMGASVSARDRKSGRSALYLAAEEANLELIRLFLDLPNALCFVNAKAYNGNTALHVAASLQYRVTQLDTVRLLMRKGADPSARNLENEQPVHLVADGPVGEQIRRILKGKAIQQKASLF